MKTALYTLSLLCWLLWPSNNAFDLSHRLIAHYTFDQCDARDETGNGSHGKLFGGSTVGAESGMMVYSSTV